MKAVLLLEGLSGALLGVCLLYLLAALLARRWLRADPYELLLSMSSAFLVAVLCEVGLGKGYRLAFGTPLWQYRVWPIHGGYTSALNFIIWPVYGYYWYFLHEVLLTHGVRVRRSWIKGLLAGVDGPLLEILANGFFLLFYRTFYFYYRPGDLRHLTSVQVIPLYMVMGVCLSIAIGYLKGRPRRWRYPVILYIAGLLFIASG